MINRDSDIKNLIIEHIKEVVKEIPIIGYDEYCKEEALEYPECYAKYAISLYYLYKIDRNREWKDIALILLDRLSQLSIEKSNLVCWGLPFNWGDTSKNDGFLISTAFVLEAFCKWNEAGITQFSNLQLKAIKWSLKLLKTEGKITNKVMHYSPKLLQNIYNAASISAATLIENKQFLTDSDIKDLISVLEGLTSVIKKRGYFNYSINKNDVDLLHQGYTCEGLLRGYINTEEKINKLRDIGIQGVEFIKNNMINSNMERYLFKVNDNESIATKLKYLVLRFIKLLGLSENRFQSPRAWSYASALRTFLLANQVNNHQYENEIEFIKTILLTRFSEGEKFKYKKDDSNIYIRHQSHVIEALSLYLHCNSLEMVKC